MRRRLRLIVEQGQPISELMLMCARSVGHDRHTPSRCGREEHDPLTCISLTGERGRDQERCSLKAYRSPLSKLVWMAEPPSMQSLASVQAESRRQK